MGKLRPSSSKASTGKYADLLGNYVEIAGGLRTDGFTTCRCPFHEDTNPSAGIDLNTGVFHCERCNLTLSPAKFLSRVTDTPLDQTTRLLDEYRRDRKIIGKEGDKTLVRNLFGNPTLRREYEMFDASLSAHDVVVEYAESRGLRIETLEHFGVRYDKTRKRIAFPFWYGNQFLGMQFRDADGSKAFAAGSANFLFGEGIDDHTRVVVLAEGQSDVMAIRQTYADYEDVTTIRFLGVPTNHFRAEWLRELEGIQHIILCPQADSASLELIKEAKELLGKRLTVIEPKFRRGQSGKDWCEWLPQNDPKMLTSRIKVAVEAAGKPFAITHEEFEKQAYENPKVPLIPSVLNERDIVIMGGPAKAMKTLTVISILKSVMLGTDLFDMPNLKVAKKGVRVLIIEEEGAMADLADRVNNAFADVGGMPNKREMHWKFREGYQLDTQEGIEQLIQYVEDYEIGVVVIDPLVHVHSQDENVTKEMKVVWDNVKLLVHRTTVAVIILHHFGKNAQIEQKWDAFRGSTSAAGVADLGIFVQKDGEGRCKLLMDGRNQTPKGSDGEDIIQLEIAIGGMRERRRQSTTTSPGNAKGKTAELLKYITEKGETKMDDLKVHFNMSSVSTIRGWVTRGLSNLLEIHTDHTGCEWVRLKSSQD